MPRPPRAEVAIFDASPLIFLARLGLLRQAVGLFKESVVAEAAHEEVLAPGRRAGAPEVPEIEAPLQEGRMRSEAPPDTPLGRSLAANPRLSRADRESLVLASTRGARLLADDSAVRSAATRAGIPLGGTLSVLFALVGDGSLPLERALEDLDRLVDLGWYCSAPLYRAARAALEERVRR